MSLNYTTLQAAILAQAARAELTTEVVEFIRRCEAMIRRELDAYEVRTTLDESDRSSSGLYNLSGQVKEVRAVYATASDGSTYQLENVGVRRIRELPATADVQQYAVSGQQIEFRGVPGTDAELELVTLGWPDPLATTASNSLLTNHEDIYLYGSLFHLYQYTQDLELAQSALDTFGDAVEKVNRAHARLNGGGSIAPAYNFGHVRIGRGY